MGNICRSPVAAEITRVEFERAGVAVRIESAGTENYHIGARADTRSIASARAHGFDLGRHRARQVCADDFAAFDAILAMDRVNLSALTARCPRELAGKPGLFLPFAGLEAPAEVPDPYYGGSQDFERVIELARLGARGLLGRRLKAHNVPETLAGDMDR
jgi:protein-tyrosine phosphatase